MPLAIVIIKLISKVFLVTFCVFAASYGVRSFKKIMNNAVSDFKTNTSREKRADIIGAYCVIGAAAVAVLGLLAIIIMF